MPVALLGRLAVQLKMITMDQLTAATREQGSKGDGRKLGEILVELGYISEAQLGKLQAVQQQVIAKHRAKQAETGRTVSPQEMPERPATVSRPAPPVRAPESPAAEAPSPPTVSAVSDPPESSAAAPAIGERAEEARPRPPRPAAAAPVVVHDEAESLALEVPSPSESDLQRLQDALRSAVGAGASDIHIHSGAPMRVRVGGVLVDAAPSPVGREEAEGMVAAALTETQRDELAREGQLDFCLDVASAGRFRCNAYRQQRGLDVVFRSIPAVPPTLEELNLPSSLAKYTNYHQGMVLVTGPAGCGKSATLAALVNLINEEREEHILTVEDPIEVIHPSKRSLVNQRQAGRHTSSFARALRGALREDPDVIVIGELRDLETISLAMTAAETGHFVLATLHTNNAVRTINRMIGAFPSNQQGQVRAMLSESLRAVISQRLVPTADESGRVPALEILVITKAIGNLIRDEKTIQVRSAIQTGRNQGMCLLEQSLNELVKEGKVSKEVALAFAEDKKQITAG